MDGRVVGHWRATSMAGHLMVMKWWLVMVMTIAMTMIMANGREVMTVTMPLWASCTACDWMWLSDFGLAFYDLDSGTGLWMLLRLQMQMLMQ